MTGFQRKSLFLLSMLAFSAPLSAQPMDNSTGSPSSRSDSPGNLLAREVMVKVGASIPADCDHAWAESGSRFLCLQRRHKKLLQISTDGVSQTDAITTLKKPMLVAQNTARIAVIDDNHLQVFDRQGRHLSAGESDPLTRPQAIAFTGRFIMVLDRSDRRYSLYDLDGRLVRPEPETMRQLQLKRPFALAADTQGNLYIADSARDEIVVFNTETGKSVLLPIKDNGKPAKLMGVATDANDRLYVLLRGADRKYAIWVLRGPALQYRLPLESVSKPSDLHTIPGAAGELSVFDADENRLHRFTYQAVPERVIGPQVNGYEHHAIIKWHPVPDQDIGSYALYASDADSGPLHKIGLYSEANVDVRFENRRYRRFAVSAISTTGIEGPTSIVASNNFEPAFLEYRNSNYAAASELFKTALQSNPENESLLKYFGLSLLQAGRHDFAAQVFRQWQSIAEDKQEARFYLAMALFRQHRFTQADELMMGLLKIKRPGVEVLSLCADLYRAMHQSGKAEACLQQRLIVDKNDYLSRLELAQLQSQSKDRKRAETDIARIEKAATRDKNSKLLVAVGQAYDALGKSARAIDSFERALTIEPKLSIALVSKAEALRRQNRYTDARSIALGMIQDEPLQAEGYRLMAEVLVTQQRLDEAILSYRKSVAASPTMVESWIGMARTYQRLKNSAQLETTLEQALAHDPDSFELWLMRGQHEFDAGRYEEAREPLHRANWLRPESSTALVLLAKTYRVLGQLDTASMFGSRALEQTPGDLSLIEMLAAIARQQGDYQQAIAYYRKASSLKKNSSHYYHELGASYYEAGDFTGARRNLEYARKLSAKYVPTNQLLARTYHELKMYSAAINILQPLVKVRPTVENKLYLKQLISERARHQAHSLSVEKIEALPVHSALIGPQTEFPILRITLRNPGKQTTKNIGIHLYMDEFLSQPVEVEVPVLAPGKQFVTELKAPANAVRFRQMQDKAILAEIQISYPGKAGEIDIHRSRMIPVLGMRTVKWSSPDSLKSLAANVRECGAAEQAVREYLSSSHIRLAEPLIHLSSLSVTLAAYDVQVREAGARATEDFYRVPSLSQLLQSRTGTPEDLRALAFTCLRHSGFELQWLRNSPPTLLINSGLSWDRRSELTANDNLLAKLNGKAWIAVDTDLLARDAGRAWAKGASAVAKTDRERLNTVTAAGVMPATHNKNDGIDQELVIVPDAGNLRWLIGRQLRALLATAVAADPGEGPNVVSNTMQAADRYVAVGVPDLAIAEYRKLIAANRYHAAAYGKLANLYANQGRYELAAEYYRTASRLNLFQTDIESGESAVLQRLQPAERQHFVQGTRIAPIPLAAPVR